MVDDGLRYQMYMLCPVQYPLPHFLWFFFQVYGRKWRPFWIVRIHPGESFPLALTNPHKHLL